MSRKRSSQRKHQKPKAVLRLPDLDQTKSAVLNSLSSVDAQRGYRHAIDEFVEWYCSEPRLSFSRTVVLRYRMHLESRHLAPGTINLRLGAVRRLAYEAADCGLLSPDLAAGIRRVKGVKKIGVRLGNWLTAEQSQILWQAPNGDRLKEKRDRALLAMLLACGLRWHEAVDLDFRHVQQREEHWRDRRPEGKSGTRPHHSNACMGKGGCRSVAPGSEYIIGQVIPTGAQDWEGMGKWTDRKGGVACCSGVCRESRH
jgi:integrase